MIHDAVDMIVSVVWAIFAVFSLGFLFYWMVIAPFVHRMWPQEVNPVGVTRPAKHGCHYRILVWVGQGQGVQPGRWVPASSIMYDSEQEARFVSDTMNGMFVRLPDEDTYCSRYT